MGEKLETQSEAETEPREDPLEKLVATFDWKKCVARVDVSKQADLLRVLEIFLRSPNLVLRFPNERLSAARVSFVAGLTAALAKLGLANEVATVHRRVAEGARFETALHEIVAAVGESAGGKLQADVHAWALAYRFAEQIAHIQRQTLASFKEMHRVFDPIAAKVKNDDGDEYRPDVVLHQCSSVTAQALTMLAVQNRWLEADGRVVLPPHVGVIDKDMFAAGATEQLGSMFAGVAAWAEEWRFWGGSVDVRSLRLEGEDDDCEVVRFTPALHPAIVYDHVAAERLNRYLLDNLHELGLTASVRGVVGVGEPAALAPQQYVSREEAFAVVGLCGLVNFQIADDVTEHGGLRLVEWVRGYAWAQRLAASASGLGHIDNQVAVRELKSLGLSEAKALAFVQYSTLSKGSEDLFDTPFIASKDGNLYFHAAALKDLLIPRVVLSRLSRLKSTITRKGKAFEAATIRKLREHGFDAKRVHFKRDGEEFEFDAAFVWDRVLFIFECKAYSLPLLNAQARFWFQQNMADALTQADRLASAATTYSDEVRKQLACGKWNKVVPVVLNSLPWSFGKVGEIILTDFSAVARFLETPTFYIKLFAKVGGVDVMVRHHLKRFWKGDKPTAREFIKAMKEPWQLRTLRHGFQYRAGAYRWSQGTVFEGAFLSRKTPDIGQTVSLLGIPNPTSELEEIQRQLNRTSRRVERASGKKTMPPEPVKAPATSSSNTKASRSHRTRRKAKKAKTAKSAKKKKKKKKRMTTTRLGRATTKEKTKR